MSAALRKRIEEDTILIDRGQETYSGLAKRYNVKAGDIFVIHQQKLRRMRGERAENELEALEEKIEKRRKELEALDDDYGEKKALLEEEINKLQRQKRRIEEIFKSQGLGWTDGLHLISEISSLREEKKRLNMDLVSEISSLGEEKKRLNVDLAILRRQLKEWNARIPIPTLREAIRTSPRRGEILTGNTITSKPQSKR